MLRVLWMLILAAWMGWAAGPVVDYARAASDKPLFSTWGWKTNFEKHSVPYEEILSGGPPKDGIPAVDNPKFVSQKEADKWLKNIEPVVVVEHKGEARAYPLQILTWHEIVNDQLNGLPVSVTFCPLCNAAIAFDRRLDGRLLDFGTTGKLRNSDLVMYDRQTESWWQQFTGEAIIGDPARKTTEHGARLNRRLRTLQEGPSRRQRALAQDRVHAGLRPKPLYRL